MAYTDKDAERAAKRKWYRENQDKVNATRERYNEKRRQMRAENPSLLAEEARRKRMKRLKMTEEEFAVYEQQKLEEKRKYNREWARAHSEGRYAKIKARMEIDPEFAKKTREQWARHNAKRNRVANETPVQRERRLQRDRENRAKIAREKKLMEALMPGKKATPKVTISKPATPKFKPPAIRKMGRFQALSKWHGL